MHNTGRGENATQFGVDVCSGCDVRTDFEIIEGETWQNRGLSAGASTTCRGSRSRPRSQRGSLFKPTFETTLTYLQGGMQWTARRLFRNQTTDAVSGSRAKETRVTAVGSPSLHNGLREHGAGFCNAALLPQFPTGQRGCVLCACAARFTSVGEVPLLGNLHVARSVSSFSRSIAGFVFITVFELFGFFCCCLFVVFRRHGHTWPPGRSRKHADSSGQSRHVFR